MTVSEMVFQPMPEDNGKLVTCSVTTGSANGVGSAALLKDSWRLDVKRKLTWTKNTKTTFHPVWLGVLNYVINIFIYAWYGELKALNIIRSSHLVEFSTRTELYHQSINLFLILPYILINFHRNKFLIFACHLYINRNSLITL